MYLDENGQPVLAINAKRRAERDVDRLIGMVDGVLLDGVVTQQEAEMLLLWMNANQHAANSWPANVLYERLERMLADGVLDQDEERELLDLLVQITGGPATHDAPASSTTLPLTLPEPDVVFQDRSFCITGTLMSGSRKEAHALIEALGGTVSKTVTMKLDYLVIGEVGSRDWLHSSYGRKIMKAVEYRDQGKPIQIVGEQHWVSFVV